MQNINLDIYENQITAIIGPSGCGKSTYIKTLNRMVELVSTVKTAGKILYRNQDILIKNILKNNYVQMAWSFNNLIHFQNQYTIILLTVQRFTALKIKVLDEIVEKSLRGAAIWDELKDRLHTNAYSLSVGNNSVFVSRVV